MNSVAGIGLNAAEDLPACTLHIDDIRMVCSTHKVAPVGEQIGILRDQIVYVLNALGIEPTEEFARLNEIAIREIEAARKKKEALDENDTS